MSETITRVLHLGYYWVSAIMLSFNNRLRRNSSKATVLVSFLVISGINGCVGETHYPLSKEVRDEMGSSIGIIVTPVTLKPEIETPFMRYRSGVSLQERLIGAGHQALDGIKSGASFGTLWGSHCYAKGCLLQLALALATASVGATLGGTAGAVSGALAGDVALNPEVAQALHNVAIEDILQQQVFGTLNELKDYRFTKISFHEDVKSSWDRYTALRANEVESLIELSMVRAAFVGVANEGVHALSVTVDVKVKKASSRLFAMRRWEYSSADYSRQYTFAEWQANDGQRLGEELARFASLVGWYIKTEFFTCPPGYCCQCK